MPFVYHNIYLCMIIRTSIQTVTDHHTYILDLAKIKQTGVPEWEFEYSAKVIYLYLFDVKTPVYFETVRRVTQQLSAWKCKIICSRMLNLSMK